MHRCLTSTLKLSPTLNRAEVFRKGPCPQGDSLQQGSLPGKCLVLAKSYYWKKMLPFGIRLAGLCPPKILRNYRPSHFPKKISMWGYSIPRAATITDHKVGGSAQQEFVLSQFWGPDIWNQGVSRATLRPKGDSLGKNHSLPLPASGGPRCSLVRDPITLISASVVTMPPAPASVVS